MTRPFSIAAYILRTLWDGVPMLVWLALGLEIYRSIVRLLDIQRELSIPFAVFGCWFLMYALRPVRKFLMLRCYVIMLRMPVKAVNELAIWKLLLVNDRYWRSELPDYLPTALFVETYASLSARGAQRLNKILWQVEYVGRPHLAKPARGFLREVNAPLRDE